MGVYIKGMEMPTSCKECHLLQEMDECYWCGCNSYLVFGDEEFVPDYVMNGCPLIPVPEHGRLIDADALVERIEGIWDCNDMVFRPNDKICKIPEDCKGCKWAQTKDCIQRMVENAPTIIPAEEGE